MTDENQLAIIIEAYSATDDDLVKKYEYDFNAYFLLLREIAVGYSSSSDFLMVNPHRIDLIKAKQLNSIVKIENKYFDYSKYELFIYCSIE